MQANWNDVLKLAMQVFAQQRIELQILIGLAVAFSAIMLIEGLRANFFPARRAAAIQKIAAPERMAEEPVRQAMAEAHGAMQHFTPRRTQAYTRNPKRKPPALRTQKPPRPTIRRMANAQYPQDGPP